MKKITNIFIIFSFLFSFKLLADESYVKVLHWNNKNMGFGHVALEVFENKDQEKPTYYISYAMGNNPAVDLQKHGKPPKVFTLPLKSHEDFLNFEEWYLDSEYSDPTARRYGASYDLFKNNCAHALGWALIKFGYPAKLKMDKLLTPVRIKWEAQRIIKRERKR